MLPEFPIKFQLMSLRNWIHTEKVGMLAKCAGLTRKDMLSPLLTQSFVRSSNVNFDNTSLAKTVLVPSVTKALDLKPFNFAQSPRFITKPKQGTSPLNNKRKPATPGMDSFKERLSSEGISKASATLIANARRSGTITHYELSWGKWYSWCVRRQIDPIKCPLTHILDFLTDCFHEGFQFSTIAGFRSAFSAYHGPTRGITVGSNPRVPAHLSGIFNSRPPQPKYTFIWDVKRVIEFLKTLPYDSDLSLKDLTIKLTMLLTLTSAARASEICYLDTRYLIKHNSGYIFHF